MTLAGGTRVGPYQILGSLGAGGMGEVYRARDTKLNRDVALKVLPHLFASDPDRLARFTREAQTLAALNHPNIAQIYGTVEGTTPDSSAVHALVMELIEGEDLARRIGRGPLATDEAVEIGRQIAEALESAHEQGIIHRDLKPANIKVRRDGLVKVLDFGLAKAMDSGSTPDQMNSPTFTSPATQLGMILGTAAYMAPEQARGKVVDRRADIWSFGVVLYEMLTGKPLWVRETAAETLACVITQEPDVAALPDAVPARLRALISRCLVKEPKQRLRDIGEARIVLGEIASGQGPVTPGVSREPSGRPAQRAWMMAAAATVAAIVFGVLWQRSDVVQETLTLRASLEPPADTLYEGGFALSPEGQRLAFDAREAGDVRSALWVRDLGTGAATRIENTDGGSLPFWSPDGKQLGFFAEGKLKRIDLRGGPAQVIASVRSARGGAWGPDDRIVYSADFRGGLFAVDASGGTAAPLTSPGAGETSHRWPVLAGDGRQVLFLSQTIEGGTGDDTSSIDVVSLDGSGRRKLILANSSPLYAGPGHVLFWRSGTLFAQQLDTERLEPVGEPFAVADDVAYDQNERALASVAGERLVFMTGGFAGQSTLTLTDRTGKALATLAKPGAFECGLDVSPDGSRLVVGRTEFGTNGCELWMYDFAGSAPTPLLADAGDAFAPRFVATNAGSHVVFVNTAGRGKIRRVDLVGRGVAQTLFEGEQMLAPEEAGDITRDGRTLMLTVISQGTGTDIMRYDLADKKLTAIVQTPFDERSPMLSPDERWIAYVSNRSGHSQVYVGPASGDGEAIAVSSSGGTMPRWRSDGRELFFLSLPDRMMSVEVVPGAVFKATTARELFRVPISSSSPAYAVLPDGQRFVMNILDDRLRTRPITILSGWQRASGRRP
jgi:Tol biopolymer transport system component